MARPPKWKSVKDLQAQIDAYFADCELKERPRTITGLAEALDTCRQTLLNYETLEERKAFMDTITRAKRKVETFYEESMWTPKISNGVKFCLQNNFGWKEKQEIEHSGGIQIEVVKYGETGEDKNPI